MFIKMSILYFVITGRVGIRVGFYVIPMNIQSEMEWIGSLSNIRNITCKACNFIDAVVNFTKSHASGRIKLGRISLARKVLYSKL